MPRLSDYDSVELPPEGHAHPAVLIGFIDLGVQESSFKPSRQAHAIFELLDEKTLDGKPILPTKRFFNLSGRSPAFRDFVRATSGLHDISRVELRDLINKECLLAIEYVEKDTGVYADVEVKPLRGNPSGRPPRTPTTFLSLHSSDFDERVFAGLPEWMREKIVKSPTYAQLRADLAREKEPRKPAREIINDDFPENLGGASVKEAAE